MPVDAATWHDIYKGYEQLLGQERAAAVMTLLPNIDWDQVVLRPHLEAAEHRLGERIEKTATAQTRWLVGTMVTVMLAYASVTIYLVQTLLSRIPVPNRAPTPRCSD